MIVARARACLGARFRAHGRDPAGGLDCVGVVAVALGARDAPDGYAMRRSDAAGVADRLWAAGLRPVDEAMAGDVLLAATGPGQLHLAIWTGSGVIHADAMLRRVVERPGDVPWPVLEHWRIGD